MGSCLEFCTFQRNIFVDAQRSADRAAVNRKVAEERLTEGAWGFSVSSVDGLDEDTFFGLSDTNHKEKADSIAGTFNEGIQLFLQFLDNKVNGTSMTAEPITPGETQHPLEGLEDNLESLRSLALQLGLSTYY